MQRAKSAAGRIERGMRVSAILAVLPHAEQLLARYGLSCSGCSANTTESLEEGCRSHGMPEAEIDDLVTDLNELLAHRPDRPATLEITEAAARALFGILEAEGKTAWGLLVALDEEGGFCMELREEAAPDDAVFTNAAAPGLRVFASPITLRAIGGATVDFRDGRFKLDMQGDVKGAGCACGGRCSCKKLSANEL